MNSMSRNLLPLALLIAPALAIAEAGDVRSISKEEYYAATYYKTALDHPSIQKIKSDDGKLKAVAKDIKIAPKKLEAAIAKVDALGGDPADLAASAIKSALSSGRCKGKVLDVLLNTEQPKHVVAYVRWQASGSKDVVKEASEIAHAVAEAAPFVSTLSLAAIAPTAPKSSRDAVWSAKIGADRMANIQPKRIDEYAERLYARLFEVVDNKQF
jgi:hypothetical protein